MATTEGYPIEYHKGDNHQDAAHPSVWQPDQSPDGELREQDRPNTTQQRILVKQEEPEQKRRHKTQTVEAASQLLPTEGGKRQELHRREQKRNNKSPHPGK